MKKYNGFNGISASMLQAVQQVSAQSTVKAIEQYQEDQKALAAKHEKFRPAATVENTARPIERLYAGMQPNSRLAKQETIGERVTALKTPKQVEESTSTTDAEFVAKVNEGWEDMLKAVKDRRDQQSNSKERTTKTGHDAKKISTGTVYQKKYNEKSGLSEAEHDPVGKEDADVNNDGKVDSSDSYLANRRKKIAAAMKKEETDTPGNTVHQCAVHVKHSKLGEGKTLFSQHAEPDTDGAIAWYDVMFEHGIERVDTADLEIVVQESHMNHKKKK